MRYAKVGGYVFMASIICMTTTPMIGCHDRHLLSHSLNIRRRSGHRTVAGRIHCDRHCVTYDDHECDTSHSFMSIMKVLLCTSINANAAISA